MLEDPIDVDLCLPDSPLKEFLVRPALPAQLSRMTELAHNVLWNWDHSIRAYSGASMPPCGGLAPQPVLLLGRFPGGPGEGRRRPSLLALYAVPTSGLTPIWNARTAPHDPLIAYFQWKRDR